MIARCFFLSAFFWAASLEAQAFVPFLNLYTTYTDNLFQTRSRRPDWIRLAYLDLDYRRGEEFGLYYSGSAHLFQEYQDLFSHAHRLGLSYSRPGAEGEAVQAGAHLGMRLDRPLYEHRDFVEAGAFARLKRYLRPDLLARLGYVLHYQEYLNAPDYSFVEQQLHGQFTHFLPTRTTLQAGGELGLKTYTRPSGESVLSDRPARPGQDRLLLQSILHLKAAQSLGQGTGLQLEYRHRAPLSGQSRYAGLLLYNPDDELFDDRYSHAGYELNAALKHLGAWGLEWEGNMGREKRRYAGRPALDLEGLLLDLAQQERRHTLRLGAKRRFYPAKGPQEIVLDLEWLYRDISSNDPYYDTQVRTYSAGMQIGF
jgi:hypothetical protein